MKNEFRDYFNAVLDSREYARFFEGVNLCIPKFGVNTKVKIIAANRCHRTPGYRFTKYSYAVQISSSCGHTTIGYGESDYEQLALQKSISETIERIVHKIVKSHSAEVGTTSGWAAHLSPEQSTNNAKLELLERDTSLLHWLSGIPFVEIIPETFSYSLKSWISNEHSQAPRFNQLKILKSTLGIFPSVVTLLMDASGHAFVSQSTAANLSSAIEKSLAEVCRFADFTFKGITTNGTAIDEPTTPEGHGVYYALKEKIPSWLFGKKIEFREANKTWLRQVEIAAQKLPQFETNQYTCGSLTVSHVKTDELMNLYFGSTRQALQSGKIVSGTESSGIFS